MTTAPPLSDFQFLGYRLESVAFTSRAPQETNEGREYTLRLRREMRSKQLRDTGCLLEVALEVQFGFGGDPAGPFEFLATVSGAFHAAPALADELLDRMATLHAPALLYAQLRPISRIIASEAGHAFILPLVNVAAMVAQENAVSEEKEPEGSNPP